MNKMMVLLSLAAIAASVCSAQGKPKLTPEQREERKYRHFGGHIYQKLDTKVICIESDESCIAPHALTQTAEVMSQMLRLPVRINETKDAGLRIQIVRGDGRFPLAVMPDNARAVIDISALAQDHPSQEVLNTRVCKELWRAFIYTLGGGNTLYGQCVMKQISSLRELDAIPVQTACPDAFMRIAESAGRLGIKPERRVTYRQACKEGWAPAPTNEVQTAIWEQIKADKERGPTNPIEIPRPKKK